MTRQFDVVVEKDSDGFFVASVPALSGCHTQARSLDELMERIREAIELCLEVHEGDIEQLDFVGVQRIIVYACRNTQRSQEKLDYSTQEGWLSCSESEGQPSLSSPPRWTDNSRPNGFRCINRTWSASKGTAGF